VFSNGEGPRALILGLHWIQRPFPHRGPAWLAAFGRTEAQQGRERFEELWRGAHDIGPAVLQLLRRTSSRWGRHPHRESPDPSTRPREASPIAAARAPETGGIRPLSPYRPTGERHERGPFLRGRPECDEGTGEPVDTPSGAG
jgi:hypothetical protein